MGKRVLLIIAHHGFQPKEYTEPKGVLQAAGVEVITASDQPGTAISSISNEEAKVDMTLADVNLADYDGVFVVGGPGALEHLDNEKLYKIIREAVHMGKAFGAICISPRILAKAGVLNGKKVTGWNDDMGLDAVLKQSGATHVRQSVVVDGKLVTGCGPVAAEEFGRAILSVI